MRSRSPRRPTHPPSSPRRRTPPRGFSLLEVIVVVAVILILGAALIPNLAGVLDRARVDAATESLYGLVDAMTAMREDNQVWPGRLEHLSRPITTADTNICGTTYTQGRVTNWAGPYVDRVIPPSGVPVGIGVAQNALVRQIVSGGDGYLVIVVTGVTVEDAEALNREVDADGSSTAGTVRWTTPPSAEGLVTLNYLRPIRGC